MPARDEHAVGVAPHVVPDAREVLPEPGRTSRVLSRAQTVRSTPAREDADYLVSVNHAPVDHELPLDGPATDLLTRDVPERTCVVPAGGVRALRIPQTPPAPGVRADSPSVSSPRG